jgi:multiple sugar transport system permease protein
MENADRSPLDNPLYRLDHKRDNRFRYRHQWSAYAMLLPAVILVTIFVIIPLVMALFRAFQDYNTKAFVGWTNFEYLFQSDVFLSSFGNVLIMTAIITAATLILSFFFALVLKYFDNKFGEIAKIIIYIPCFISGIATSIIFGLLTNYGGGLLTSIAISLGLDPVSFTDNTTLARMAIIIPTIWIGFGSNTLVLYAGLINIPKEYYEAASIDGANWSQKLWDITIPSMRNYFVLQLVSLITGNMQMMEIPLMVTGGGPLNTTMTPVLFLYNSYRDTSRPQNATIAGALIIMLIIGSINWIVFKTISSRRSEDA